MTSENIFCLSEVQILFFYLIFSGMCCLKMAALGKDGFTNLLLAKPLSPFLRGHTHAPLQTDPVSVCCVFFFMIFSVCMTLIPDFPPLWGFSNLLAICHFVFFCTVCCSEAKQGWSHACTYSAMSCALFPERVIFFLTSILTVGYFNFYIQ